MTPGDTYVCAHCAGIFETDWTDDEAEAEANDNFGDLLGDDPAIVCDDCYQAMVSVKPPKEWAGS